MAILSLGRLLAATGTIIVTTLGDCVWLVPLVSSQASSRAVRVRNAVTFVVTFQILAVAACAVALLVTDQSLPSANDIVLEAIAASVCWGIAIYLYCRKRLSNKHRQEQSNGGDATVSSLHHLPSSILVVDEDNDGYGSIRNENLDRTSASTLLDRANSSLTYDDGDETRPVTTPTIAPNHHESSAGSTIWMIISLTVLGSLDEVSYFPALIVGKVFTVAELCLGTLLASLLILLLVSVSMRHCAGACFEMLDQLPLYVVIAMFAALMTAQVIYDVVDS